MALAETVRTALFRVLGWCGADKVLADAIDANTLLLTTAVQRVNAGSTKVVGGTASCTGAASIVLDTSLVTVAGFSCIQVLGTAPTPITVTCTVAAGVVTIFFWKATASGDTTLIAATGNWVINWVATGV